MLLLTKLAYISQGLGILTLVIDQAHSAGTAWAIIGLLCLTTALILREDRNAN